jgi:membrane protease YdiL (CAAX protease family)
MRRYLNFLGLVLATVVVFVIIILLGLWTYQVFADTVGSASGISGQNSGSTDIGGQNSGSAAADRIPNPYERILFLPEIYTGIGIVVGIAALIVLLAFLAKRFKELGVENKNEALGLPAGSIRALIALFLLLVFVVFSIYLFRQVSSPPDDWVYRGQLNAEERAALGNAIYSAIPISGTNTLSDVWIRIDSDNQAAQQLAQQIITATLTLVTAVSSFYFASRTAAEENNNP